MDVLTQLEQACAHGCVLLSETFAVALRPTDPAFSGDGVALRRASGGAAAPPPASPAEGSRDAGGGSGVAKDPTRSAAAIESSSTSPSLRLSLSTSAISLPHVTSASVTVRRLGLHRVPTFSTSAPIPTAASEAAGSAGDALMASIAATGDAFDLLPAADMDLIGAEGHAPKRGDLPGPLCMGRFRVLAFSRLGQVFHSSTS